MDAGIPADAAAPADASAPAGVLSSAAQATAARRAPTPAVVTETAAERSQRAQAQRLDRLSGAPTPRSSSASSSAPAATPQPRAGTYPARLESPRAPSRVLQNAMASTTPLRRAVLAVASGELGVHELPNPTRSGPGSETPDPTINDDREGRIRLYHQTARTGRQVGAGHDSEGYCAAFVTFCLKHGGVTTPRGSADPRALRGQCETAGRFHSVPQDRPYDPSIDHRPQPGDLIFFGSPGHETHVGLVVSVAADGTIRTLEGNTYSGKETDAGVMERTQSATRRSGAHRGERTQIVGFGSIE